ncbi:sensor histidine kinase [Tepidibacter hydrothermalis]|uniref:GHKL domain-containing protein n=1 Tax=Tepidibacter hydrothermalis TaxID=3036126 RepID=A0ABY8EGR0_9FIRM|nr:GHKL domain-containing protein [Tepidibacter hydrothermalis]WFD10774.1 GHKL domain-containing protein [Tepidibacter hydrothermalis]
MIFELSLILTVFLTVYILKKIKFVEFENIVMESENILWIYNISILITFVTIMYYYKDVKNNINQYIIVFGIIFFNYILVSYVIFYILNKLKIEKNQKKQIELYSNTIEESLENLKEFKHDCKNILISMEGFIQGDDYEGLKMYFYENLINNRHISNNNIYELSNIKNTAVKGLINNKCSRAVLLGIELNLNIINYIDDFILKDIDICKILGILIDNAIESSLESKDKIINIGIYNDDDEVYIIVSNSFELEPKIHDIFKNGYSTKGESRGLGLNIVRKLNDIKYKNIQMNTFIKDRLFNQELSILKKEN